MISNKLSNINGYKYTDILFDEYDFYTVIF